MEYPQPSSSGIVTNTDDRFMDKLSEFKSAVSSYNPASFAKSTYDTGKLADVGSLMDVEDDGTSASADLQNKMGANADNEASKSADLKNGMNKKDTSSGGLLSMVFGIVKTGVNIAKKGKTIAAGLKEIPTGIGTLIANLAIMTMILGFDTFDFLTNLSYYLFKLLICSVGKLMDAPKCVSFYFIDLAMFVMFMIVVSFLFIIDMIFMVKFWIGISFVELFMMSLKMMETIDSTVHGYIKIHLFHYPDIIINKCYRCSMMGDTSGFWNAANRMFNDIFIMLPTNIGEPIGEIITGFKHVFGLFS